MPKSALLIYSIIAPAALLTADSITIEGNPEEIREFLAPKYETIHLTAEAEKDVQADKAKVNLKVQREDRSFNDAVSKSRNTVAQVETLLKKNGFSQNAIQSSKFTTTPNSGGVFNGKSYTVTNRLNIEVVNESQFELITQIVDKNKDIEFDGIKFEFTKEDQTQEELQKEAIEKILAEKTFYENSLKVKLLPISFSSQTPEPTLTFEDSYNRAKFASRPNKLSISSATSSIGSYSRKAPEPVNNPEHATLFDTKTYKSRQHVSFRVIPLEE